MKLPAVVEGLSRQPPLLSTPLLSGPASLELSHLRACPEVAKKHLLNHIIICVVAAPHHGPS